MKNHDKFIKGTKNILNSFKYAFKGIYKSFKSERNMKIHVFIMTLVIVLGFIYKLSIYEWFICLLLFGTVISAELFNTAIEALVDMTTPYHNEKAGLIKDISAGAVLVMALIAAITGFIIFIPKIFNL